MEQVICLSTRAEYTIPERIVFDMPRFVEHSRRLITFRNQGSESPIEVTAGIEMLLKDIGLSEEGMLMGSEDIYGVRAIELKEVLENEIERPLRLAAPYLSFCSLNLVHLIDRTATFEILSMVIDENYMHYEVP